MPTERRPKLPELDHINPRELDVTEYQTWWGFVSFGLKAV